MPWVCESQKKVLEISAQLLFKFIACCYPKGNAAGMECCVNKETSSTDQSKAVRDAMLSL